MDTISRVKVSCFVVYNGRLLTLWLRTTARGLRKCVQAVMPDGIDDLRRRECVRGGYDGGIDDVSVQVHASELKLNLTVVNFKMRRGA